MTSLRNNEVAEPSSRDDYLDAARACILDVGWRRTTLTEVARRAGVSRMTIYRTWTDMPQLLGDLMTREWGTVVSRASTSGPSGPSEPDEPGTGPSLDRLLEAITATMRALRENELFLRIVELDPELLLPYLLARRGRSQEGLLGLVQGYLEAGQRTGTIRAGNAPVMARSLLLGAHGFVLSAQTMVDDTVTEDDLEQEFRVLLERALKP